MNNYHFKNEKTLNLDIQIIKIEFI